MSSSQKVGKLKSEKKDEKKAVAVAKPLDNALANGGSATARSKKSIGGVSESKKSEGKKSQKSEGQKSEKSAGKKSEKSDTKTAKSDAKTAKSAATSAMRTVPEEKAGPQDKPKNMNFNLNKVAPSGSVFVDRSVPKESDAELEKVEKWPLMAMLTLLFLGPITFFGVTGANDQGACNDSWDACAKECDNELIKNTSNLRGQDKYQQIAATTARKNECVAECTAIQTQCTSEALLKLAASISMIFIFVCVGMNAKVNFFVDKRLKAMEEKIADEATELALKEKAAKDALLPKKRKGKNKKDDDSHSVASGSKRGETDATKTPRSGGSKGDTTARSEKSTEASGGKTADMRSEASSAMTSNIAKGLDDIVLKGKSAKNPYAIAKFTGSRNARVKCPYCSQTFYNEVPYDLAEGALATTPVVCMFCHEVVSGII